MPFTADMQRKEAEPAHDCGTNDRGRCADEERKEDDRKNSRNKAKFEREKKECPRDHGNHDRNVVPANRDDVREPRCLKIFEEMFRNPTPRSREKPRHKGSMRFRQQAIKFVFEAVFEGVEEGEK